MIVEERRIKKVWKVTERFLIIGLLFFVFWSTPLCKGWSLGYSCLPVSVVQRVVDVVMKNNRNYFKVVGVYPYRFEGREFSGYVCLIRGFVVRARGKKSGKEVFEELLQEKRNNLCEVRRALGVKVSNIGFISSGGRYFFVGLMVDVKRGVILNKEVPSEEGSKKEGE